METSVINETLALIAAKSAAQALDSSEIRPEFDVGEIESNEILLTELDTILGDKHAIHIEELASILRWEGEIQDLHLALDLCESHCRFTVTLDGIILTAGAESLLPELKSRLPCPAPYQDAIDVLDRLTQSQLTFELLDALLFDGLDAIDARIGEERLIVAYGKDLIGDRVAAILLHFPDGGSIEDIKHLYSSVFPGLDDHSALPAILATNPRYFKCENFLWRSESTKDQPFVPTSPTPPRQSPDSDLAYAIVRILMEVVKADQIVKVEEEEVIANFFENDLGYSTKQMWSVWRLIEEAKEDKADLVLITEGLLSTEEALRELLLETAVEVALVDDHLHPAEEMVILNLIEKLELSPTATASVLNELRRGNHSPPASQSDYLRILGLASNASPIDARAKYREQLDRFHPDKLAHHGSEFALLGERRRKIFQLAFEQLQSDSSFWCHRALCPDPKAIRLTEFQFSEKFLQWFSLLKFRTLADLANSDSSTLLNLPNFDGEHWRELCENIRGRYPELCDSDPKLRDFLGSRTQALVELTRRVVELIDAVERPLNQADIEKRLLSAGVELTPKEISTALEHAHREGRAFYCENKRWASPRHLTMPTEKAHQVRHLAIQFLETNPTEELRCSDFRWRKDAGWDIPPVRVDFVLSSCDKLERLKPGYYRLNLRGPLVPASCEIPHRVQVEKPSTAEPKDIIPKVKPLERLLSLSLSELEPESKLRGILRRHEIRTIGDMLCPRNLELLAYLRDGKSNHLSHLLEEITIRAEAHEGAEPLVKGITQTLGLSQRQKTTSSQTPEIPASKVIEAVYTALRETLREVIVARYGFEAHGDTTSFEALSRNLSLGRERLQALELMATKALFRHQTIIHFHEQLLLHLSKVSQWQETELLPSATWDLDLPLRRSVLRLLSKIFSDITFNEVADIVTTNPGWLHELQEAKYVAQQSMPVPVCTRELVSWVQKQHKLDLATSERVVLRLWGLSLWTEEGEREPIAYAFQKPSPEKKIAAILYSRRGKPTTSAYIAQQFKDAFGESIKIEEVQCSLMGNSALFFRLDKSNWTLLRFIQQDFLSPELRSELLTYLWTKSTATSFEHLLNYVHRHHREPPTWLNEYSLSWLLRNDNRFEILNGMQVQPTGSRFHLSANPEKGLTQKSTVREGSSTTGVYGDPTGNSERNTAIQESGQLPRKALLAVAAWWGEAVGQIGPDNASALILAHHKAPDLFSAAVALNRDTSSTPSKINETLKEQLILKAGQALYSLPKEQTASISQWWSKWCETLPHGELAKVLLSAAKEGQKSKEALTAHLRTPQDSITVDEKELDSPAFFSSQRLGSSLTITLNKNHPAYSLIKESLHSLEGKAVKLLLSAWATYEQDQPDGVRKDRAGEARLDWGRVARRTVRDQFFMRSVEEAMVPAAPDNGTTAAELTEAELDQLQLRAGRLYEQGQLEDAEVIYNQILETNSNKDCFFWRAICRLDTSRYQKALEDFTSALKLDATDPESYNGRGVCHIRLASYNAAIDDFERAIQLDDEWPQYYVNLAKGFIGLNKYKEALDSLERAKALSDEKALSNEIGALCENIVKLSLAPKS